MQKSSERPLESAFWLAPLPGADGVPRSEPLPVLSPGWPEF